MAYNLKWSESKPGHLVWLVDLSYSMKTGDKIVKVIEALQSSLREIISGCYKGNGNFVPAFTTTIIGYNTDIIPLFPSSHLAFGSINNVAGLIKKANTSNEPLFNYKKGGIAEPNWMTYMTKAFNAARENIEKWIAESNGRQLPAPIVINITDGQPEEAKKSLEVCAREALEAAQRLKNVRTPDGNVLLWNLHFGDSGNLKEIQFPNSLTEIKEKAFLGCSALESINIPNTVVNIGSSAFEGCSNLKNVTLPSALKSISSNAFYNCSHAFQIVDLTNTEITDIGSNAFSACSSLKEIHLPNTCKLNKACFSGCSSLESTNIPSCMTELPAEIFMDCSSLKNIVIPEKITIIRNSAFRKCTSLEELELPDSVVKLCPFFIKHCTSLKRFNYSGNQADWKSRGVDDDRDYLTPTSGHFTLDELVNSVSIAENYWARY